MYFIIAAFIPQSWNRLIVSEGTSAMEYSPYSAGAMSLAKIIAPIAIMRVDSDFPTKSWKLPVAETLPIFKAFSKNFT